MVNYLFFNESSGIVQLFCKNAFQAIRGELIGKSNNVNRDTMQSSVFELHVFKQHLNKWSGITQFFFFFDKCISGLL